MNDLGRKVLAEFLGTAFLLAVAVGSGIMGERLAGGNTAITLLANSLATGAGLLILITIFAPVSGAHFNPAVSLVAALRRDLSYRSLCFYMTAQISGAFAGVAAAHGMFDLPVFAVATQARTGASQWWSEFVATSGLLLVILQGLRHTPGKIPLLVAAYITAAYWFTGSTAFANPAVTIARAATDTFAGIAPGDVVAFVIAQLGGALAGVMLAYLLTQRSSRNTPAAERASV